MKANFLSKGFLVVALSCITMNVLGAEKVVSSEYANDKEVAKIIYTLDASHKYLTPELRYEYNYNDAGDLIGKTTYKWNKDAACWDSYTFTSYTYNGNSVYMEYFLWSKASETFELNEKYSYVTDPDNQLVYYYSSKRDPESQEWVISTNHSFEELYTTLN